ncbi:N-succinylarginine dihydrolase [Acidithiobacillus sp. CV18-2]|uniref:N-succinylarginine dihydrolase n=1 Tax=Igneacidithiobacillus copahuensis TaxID=2724909 RepID=A0AAE2YMW7_9PROT|nr:N-succinylarginine dihydrolase [Igneacidithiobacillus copahuensis]MBU2754726.1 N-succinylarginine dihydrolase [Acidithiobacillus sp. CV18-3]MBU2758465.1 N-succinylarginine dihydrolase [Acidithiobacillus sp. BN09-2]MBU2776911.1 N-succinylarginine dihydrolase [Acidithiobacillus sp. CV18-2]MBU2797750.1 N-succinylarginine dihydrolase [Acidithiobacillus sp. VAN18-2]MBU2800564.1 N-succinylarginine dihydrolase [Acidithiobacillus sp. VAN18-4]
MVGMNVDGLVGPSHHYGGLSPGNLASAKNAWQVANPKAAALQGIAKMRLLFDLGLVQGVFPPVATPHLSVLQALGFTGGPETMLRACHRSNPRLLSAVYSASSMWMANSATISSAHDTIDHKIHVTPANLQHSFHRSLEVAGTGRVLEEIFADPEYFVHHSPLPRHADFADEGAANYMRLWHESSEAGLSLYVYGRAAGDSAGDQPKIYPARQSLAASQAVARSHGLHPDRRLFIRQRPEAIDAGAFHNDVVAVAYANVLLCHERAFAEQGSVRESVGRYFASRETPFYWLEVPENRISLTLAVQSYLFNSQILPLADGQFLLLAPEECRESPLVWDYLTELCAQDNPIVEIRAIDLRQSMHNGGGPACLRLHVPLDREALNAVHRGIICDKSLLDHLSQWIEKYYRDRLTVDDLADPEFYRNVQEALDKLSDILQLGPIYEFQRV